MTELLDMGKYGGFIWASYGVSALVIGGLMIWILNQRRDAKKRLYAAQNALQEHEAK
ncbi:MAG: heme exporter protein CcmD [Robiginitomaculum sp.]|nr:MAG: heme exporter protein CcmD [Robiginitomaculum sp.]